MHDSSSFRRFDLPGAGSIAFVGANMPMAALPLASHPGSVSDAKVQSKRLLGAEVDSWATRSNGAAICARWRRLQAVLLHLVDAPALSCAQHRWPFATRATPATRFLRRRASRRWRQMGDAAARAGERALRCCTVALTMRSIKAEAGH